MPKKTNYFAEIKQSFAEFRSAKSDSLLTLPRLKLPL